MLFLFKNTPTRSPIGAPAGMTQVAPASSSFFATIGSSEVYTSTVKPSLTKTVVAFSGLDGVGQECFSSPSTLQLDHVRHTRFPWEASVPEFAHRWNNTPRIKG